MRAEAPEPSIRGSYLSGSKAWMYKTYGGEVFQKGLALLTQEQQAMFGGEFVSLAWYPLKDWARLLEGVRAEVKARTGESEEVFDRRHIFESISRTMQTVYRIAFGLFAPTTIVSKVTPFFKKVYSHGEYEVIENQEGRCLLRFSDAPVEMLPELQRSFPLAATWMLETAGQEVIRHRLVPKISHGTFSCDLELEYRARKVARVP